MNIRHAPCLSLLFAFITALPTLHAADDASPLLPKDMECSWADASEDELTDEGADRRVEASNWIQRSGTVCLEEQGNAP